MTKPPKPPTAQEEVLLRQIIGSLEFGILTQFPPGPQTYTVGLSATACICGSLFGRAAALGCFDDEEASLKLALQTVEANFREAIEIGRKAELQQIALNADRRPGEMIQ